LRSLDGLDFAEREWVPYSGWPFGKAALDPFYERAHALLEIGPFTYDVRYWQKRDSNPQLPFANDRVQTTVFHFASRDLFFDKYRQELANAKNIDTYLHANVVEIETDETARKVGRLRISTLQGKTTWITARLFVLGMGGIEIPRLLLLSNRVQQNGLGNQEDLVGRFFMEHPHLWSGFYVPSGPHIFDSTGLYQVHSADDVAVMGKLTLAEEVLRREKLLNYCVSIHPRIVPDPKYLGTPSKGFDTLKEMRSAVRRGKVPKDLGEHFVSLVKDLDGVATNLYRKMRRTWHRARVFHLNHMAEQAPNPDSRITLGDERDALGQRRVRLNWQLSAIDVRSMIRAQEIIDEELRRAGLGRLYIEMHGEKPPADLHGGWHHMGTTRMHADPKRGVVDPNCKVHGISNLFIAGASVFPTVGYANPVLTTVALTLRLADHVKTLMQ
jgi:choline dehydrogenase-like flavoprotein